MILIYKSYVTLEIDRVLWQGELENEIWSIELLVLELAIENKIDFYN